MVSKQRSYNMSRIKSKDTSIEIKVRKYLYHKGFRYQKNVKTLPGTPDIYISNTMLLFLLTVVFWHHHYNCKYAYIPKTNQDYWINKFEKNMKNDIEHYKQLEQMDIKVIVIWECELKECFDYRMESLLEEIKNED